MGIASARALRHLLSRLFRDEGPPLVDSDLATQSLQVIHDLVYILAPFIVSEFHASLAPFEGLGRVVLLVEGDYLCFGANMLEVVSAHVVGDVRHLEIVHH